MGNEFKFLRGEKFQVDERINLRDVSYRLCKYPKEQVKKFLSFLEARSEEKYARKEFRKKRKGMWNVFIPIRKKEKNDGHKQA